MEITFMEAICSFWMDYILLLQLITTEMKLKMVKCKARTKNSTDEERGLAEIKVLTVNFLDLVVLKNKQEN